MPYKVVQMQCSNKSHFVAMVKVDLPGKTNVFDELHRHTTMALQLFMAFSVLIALETYRSVLMGLSAWLLSGVKLALLGTGRKSILLSGIAVFLLCCSAAAEAEVISNREGVRLWSGTAIVNLLKIQVICLMQHKDLGLSVLWFQGETIQVLSILWCFTVFAL